jgi:hypothetical protein
LRELFVGYDARKPDTDADERELWQEGLQYVGSSVDGEAARRVLCARAIDAAATYFQALYKDVSLAFSDLRSQLLLPK